VKGPQSTPTERKAYPSDVTDEEWAFVQPYLALIREDASQREHHLREVFNALRWVVRSGSPWRYLPTNFPPWAAVYQQTQCWIKAGCFGDLVDDLREMSLTVVDRLQLVQLVVSAYPRKGIPIIARHRANRRKSMTQGG
jgi:transposase